MLLSPFFLFPLFAAFLSSIAGGIIGSYVVAKRIVFISGSIAHSILGGIGLSLYLQRVHHMVWITPHMGAIFSALAAACVMGWIHLRHREREDTVIAAIWSTGMALGIVFLALTPGYNVEVMNYLLGNILWVTKADLWLLFSLDIFLIATCLVFHKKFLCICFDEKQAALQGLPVFRLYLLLLCLVGISVVLLIETVGAILVIAMLTIPPAIASRLCLRFPSIMIMSVFFGALFSFVGLSSAYFLNWPPGASICLAAASGYLLCQLFKKKYSSSTLKKHPLSS